jgi:glycosyltransferase involved in cell wall biosynthesis
MIIAIDARAWAWAGVGRYVRNLITGLAQIDRKNTYIILIGPEDLPLWQENAFVQRTDNFSVKTVDSSYYTWREQVIFWQQAKRVRADLWHFPNFNVPVMFRQPYVVTVHDITRFIFPGQRQQGLLKQIVYEQVFKRAVEQAAGAIFVSNATCNELNALPINAPVNTKVIYEGVEEQFYQKISDTGREKIEKMLNKRNYLLYVGVWMNHKNLPRLLEAYANIAIKHKNIDLVLTGNAMPGFVDAKKLAQRLRIDPGRIKFVGHIKDQLLPALYAGAAMLVFPSLYEGFGLPAIEAAACGTPVITANVTSLPEVMGKGAAFVNPENKADIERAIELVLTDNIYRQKLIMFGRNQAKRYLWENCAKQTLEFYQEVVKS